MKEQQPVVYLIDDDESVREGIADLLGSVGHSVQPFGSVQEFIDSPRPDAPGCIILDVRLPGMSGLEFQRSLVKLDIDGPAEIIGDNPFVLVGGIGAVWIRARELPGTVRLKATHPVLGERHAVIDIASAPTLEV